jgi:hypothetical protein
MTKYSTAGALLISEDEDEDDDCEDEDEDEDEDCFTEEEVIERSRQDQIFQYGSAEG